MRFEGGSAHATTEHPPPWTADKAFILAHPNAWHVNSGVGRILPHTVWYEFPAGKRFVPGRVSFRGRQDCSCLDQTSTMWQFVGSNDEICNGASNWTILCQDLSGSGYPHKAWTKYCEVDDKITREFRCLGITVLNTGNKDGKASFKDVRMWKKVLQ